MQMENANENLCKCLKHTSAFCSMKSHKPVFHVALLTSNFSLKQAFSAACITTIFQKKW